MVSSVIRLTPATVYCARFIHSRSRAELDSFHGVVCVVGGRIAWVERDVEEGGVAAVVERHGLQHARLVVVKEGLICPGMVDTHTVGLILRFS